MLLTALVFGLLGSFHCVGMCGPIAFLLPLDRKHRYKRILQTSIYHLGRILSYALLGLLFGLVGKSIGFFGFQQQLSILIGIIMIITVLWPNKLLDRYQIMQPIYLIVGKVKNRLGQELKKKTLDMFFTLGFLNGLLPCGLVYLAIFGALATGNPWQGSLYMIFFGLGTIPLMTTAIYLGNFLNQKIKQQIVRIIPVFVIIIGILFILRGSGLGIKYVSPTSMVTIEKANAKYFCH